MLSGFCVLCAIKAWRPKTADALEEFFDPACRFFRVWLAAIFAPGLISLPLNMPALPARELATFIGIIAAGFLSSLTTGALVASALAPRRGNGGGGGRCSSSQHGDVTGRVVPTIVPSRAPPSAYVPFPRSQQRFFMLSALVCLGAHVATSGFGGSSVALGLGMLATTLGSFSLASTLTPKTLQVYAHPFLQCSAATLFACTAIGRLTGVGWRGVLTTYASAAGAGGWLTKLLGACVLSFSLQLYAYRKPLLARSRQIVGSAFLCTFVSMLSSAAVARLAGLSSVLRLALFSRTITTALAAELGRLLSVAPSLGLLAAFSTALLGLATKQPLLARLGVTDPVTRGVALSSAAHGGAVVAMADEPEAFPFAVLTMNLSAAAAVVLLSLRPVRALLLAVAGV